MVINMQKQSENKVRYCCCFVFLGAASVCVRPGGAQQSGAVWSTKIGKLQTAEP